MIKIAIVGAGLSGLVLARELSNFADIQIFEKARGVGGRMTTRYADPYQFDHGAQYFTAQTKEFQSFLEPYIELGLIAPWDAEFVQLEGEKIIQTRHWTNEHPHYVAVPKMNQLCKELASKLNVNIKTRIKSLEKNVNHWQLTSEDNQNLGLFDWVVSTAPPEQTINLFPDNFSDIKRLEQTKMQGCFSLMLGFAESLNIPWHAAHVQNADISWISINTTKPGRPEHFSLLAHSTNSWAETHMEDDLQQVQAHLLHELERVIQQNVTDANHIALHRWRYANIEKQSGKTFLLDQDSQLAACGDWCIQGRVESAFTSATHLASKLNTQIAA